MKKADASLDAPDPYGDSEIFDYPDYPEMAEDFTVPQYYERYTEDDHKVWAELYARQMALLPGRACDEYWDALTAMKMPAERIPRFEDYTDMLMKATGWQIVGVPGLIPNTDFFTHLANKRFPVTHWIRKRAQMDYLQEPDMFHDFLGHVPLLMNPIFANYMEAYGKGGLRAMALGGLSQISRVYWYTVEFGLIRGKDGLRIYGAGILSSKGESIFCLDDPSPNRIAFDVKRIMQTDYRIDDYQETYWVIDSFEQLFSETEKTDFAPLYEAVKKEALIYEPFDVTPADRIIHRGTGAYAAAKRAAAS